MRIVEGKKVWILLLVLGVSQFGFAGAAQAQSSYPTKPVSIIVPFAAGGAAESSLRQAMVMSDGNPAIFVTRPLSAAFLCLTLASLILPPIFLRKRPKQD